MLVYIRSGAALESRSSTSFLAYGVDLGVKSTLLQSNKITDLRPASSRSQSFVSTTRTGEHYTTLARLVESAR